jgi:hypothetical protein
MTISKTTNTLCEFHCLFWSGQRVFSKNAIKFQYTFLSLKLSLTFVVRLNLTTSKQTINCLKINSGKFKIRSFRIGCWIPCAKYVCKLLCHENSSRTQQGYIFYRPIGIFLLLYWWSLFEGWKYFYYCHNFSNKEFHYHKHNSQATTILEVK